MCCVLLCVCLYVCLCMLCSFGDVSVFLVCCRVQIVSEDAGRCVFVLFVSFLCCCCVFLICVEYACLFVF
jgi:hypothetical protein